MGYLNAARPGMGDYYAGDYYGGDPFLGLGAIIGAGKALFGGLFGKPKSAPAGALQPTGVMASGGGTIGSSASGVNPGSISGTMGGRVMEWMQQHPVLSALGGAALGGAGTTLIKAFAAGGLPVGGVPAQIGGGAFGIRQRRMHPNKSTYVVRGGGTSRYPPGLNLVVKGTSLVPTRRMNVGNSRALRRALRRVAGFAKITKRVRRSVALCASAVGVRRHGKKAVRRR